MLAFERSTGASQGRPPGGDDSRRRLAPDLVELATRRGLAHDGAVRTPDRKSTRLNSSHVRISYAVFCLKKKKTNMCGNDTRMPLDNGRTARHLQPGERLTPRSATMPHLPEGS